MDVGTQLVESGATALVGFMVTEALGDVRRRVAGLLGRGGGEVTTLSAREVEGSWQKIKEAHNRGDEGAVQAAEEMWRHRLKELVAVDPDARVALRALVQEHAAEQVRQATGSVNLSGNFYNSPVQGYGTQYFGKW